MCQELAYIFFTKGSPFLIGPAPKRGGWGKGRTTKKKKLFLKLEKNVATKLEGGGVKALVAGPLKKITFFAASLRQLENICLTFDSLNK